MVHIVFTVINVLLVGWNAITAVGYFRERRDLLGGAAVATGAWCLSMAIWTSRSIFT